MIRIIHLILSLTLGGLSASVALARTGDEGRFLTAEEAVFGPRSDFRELHALARKILHRCPPSEWVYVGMGRGPTPLIALLQVLAGEQSALNLPLSGVRPYDRGLEPDRELRTDDIDPHLGRFLAPVGKRKILLIDYAQTGGSLANGRHLLRAHDPEKPVEALALARSRQTQARLADIGIPSFHISRALDENLHGFAYVSFTEYPRYFPRLNSGLGSREVNPRYPELREAFRRRHAQAACESWFTRWWRGG